MNEKMLAWDDMQLFLSVARDGGLSAAARSTGRSAATLGRRMLALERSLGRELFVRHDRGYSLTADGRGLLAELSQVESRIHTFTRAPQDAANRLVKISAGSWTTLFLLNHFDAITGNPPDVRLRFVAAEDTLDIGHRAVTIGFRNARPREAALAGRKVARVEFVPYGTRDAPDRWIRVMADTASARWLAKMVGDDAICEVTAPRNGLDLALQGVGLALLPSFIGDSQPGLQRRGHPVAELSHDQWIVTHQDDRHLPEVRQTLKRLYAVLDAVPQVR